MRRASSLRREDGQAAAEFALVLPILCVMVFAIVQFGIAFNNYLTITDATRAGSRKAAVSRFSGDLGAAAAATTRASAVDLNQSKLGVAVSATNWTIPGSVVTVTATYPYSLNILGWVIKSGNITSTTVERLE